MTEQERPRTEAGRSHDSLFPQFRDTIVAIETQAEAEGRQQAVREIRGGLFESAWRRDTRDPSPREWLDPKAASAILDRVAALNASESPHSLHDPHHDPQHAYKCAVPWCPKYVGDASESPPTLREAEAYYQGRMDEWRRIRGNEQDASESGQPSEASDE